MPRKLVWATDARRDLRDIMEFVAERNAPAAIHLRGMILECAAKLPQFPEMYRPGRVEGTREAIVHPNYILAYRVLEDRIRILRIMHARQLYP